VCLGPRLYLWNASNGAISQLLEMDNENEYVSSVAWLPDSSNIAVGTSTMEVQVLLTVSHTGILYSFIQSIQLCSPTAKAVVDRDPVQEACLFCLRSKDLESDVYPHQEH